MAYKEGEGPLSPWSSVQIRALPLFCCHSPGPEMDRKKTLLNEYKQRKMLGGVFRVTNTKSGRYLLDYAVNPQARQNSFQFMSSLGSCFDYKLQDDWETCGSKAFVFEILETIIKKDAQTQEEFMRDLQTLAQLWGEKLDPSKRY